MADPGGILFDSDGGLPRVGEGEDLGEAVLKLSFGERFLIDFELGPVGGGGEVGEERAGWQGFGRRERLGCGFLFEKKKETDSEKEKNEEDGKEASHDEGWRGALTVLLFAEDSSYFFRLGRRLPSRRA